MEVQQGLRASLSVFKYFEKDQGILHQLLPLSA